MIQVMPFEKKWDSKLREDTFFSDFFYFILRQLFNGHFTNNTDFQ